MTLFQEIECVHFKQRLLGMDRLACLFSCFIAWLLDLKGSMLQNPGWSYNHLSLRSHWNQFHLCRPYRYLRKLLRANWAKARCGPNPLKGQKRKRKAFILPTNTDIDDRITKLQMANGGFEPKVIHRLIGEELTYKQIINPWAMRENGLSMTLAASADSINQAYQHKQLILSMNTPIPRQQQNLLCSASHPGVYFCIPFNNINFCDSFWLTFIRFSIKVCCLDVPIFQAGIEVKLRDNWVNVKRIGMVF